VRLAALFLSGAIGLLGPQALLAQVSSTLPWRAAPALPWQMEEPGPPPAPCTASPTQTSFGLTVHLARDGAVRLTDQKGLIRLRAGLPGRVRKAWRDWGVPIADPFAPLPFPEHSPLQRGIGALPVGSLDFRPALEGLLWILDDDESYLTVIYPATAQVVYLPLPGGQDLDLAFGPDRLAVVEDGPAGSAQPPEATWSLHWLALLPEFIQLGKENASALHRGTALEPFPKD
jgi:hypothetical protein